MVRYQTWNGQFRLPYAAVVGPMRRVYQNKGVHRGFVDSSVQYGILRTLRSTSRGEIQRTQRNMAISQDGADTRLQRNQGKRSHAARFVCCGWSDAASVCGGQLRGPRSLARSRRLAPSPQILGRTEPFWAAVESPRTPCPHSSLTHRTDQVLLTQPKPAKSYRPSESSCLPVQLDVFLTF